MHSYIKKFYLYGYKRASKSLKQLQIALHERGFKAIRRDPLSITPPRRNHTIIVWGSSNMPNFVRNTIINNPISVELASNKLKAFLKFQEANLNIPKFTTNIEEARTLLGKGKILCRKLLSASGGKGITLASTPEELVEAPLYVKYQPKQAEYRVHIFNNEVIDTQQKRKRTNATKFNQYIRNHDNGWNFCREGITPNKTRDTLAKQAIQALGLHFGAVDIIHNTKTNTFYLLEVNTAPGLEGTTITKYADAIANL